ncbi:Alpha/beta hydrolase family protein [Lachnospiraceae bacterium RM5]|nr:Alpha/beta hydrolase family protein [Lachnospiraceae bacterium RM5]
MKYIFLILIALVIVFTACFVISGLIRRKMKKKIPIILHIILSIVAGIFLIFITARIYLNMHYSADNEAMEILLNSKSSESGKDDISDNSGGESISDNSSGGSISGVGVRVQELDNAFFLDGDGEDTVFIFYPGAKVDSEAYLPLMKKLAENGIDCFILKPPFRMAIFDINAAEKVINDYDYRNVFVGGHSMGGVVASSFASKFESNYESNYESNHESSFASSNGNKIDGIVLLAAYPNSKIPDRVPVLSIYGSEDKVLQKDAYNNAKSNLPNDFDEASDEVIIKGGNHAYFGNYGEQRGDGKATISREEQQSETASAIIGFVNEKTSLNR